MSLLLPLRICRQLRDAANAAAPIEACGLLGGRNGRVERFYPMTNADASAEHFSLIPKEQFDVSKAMRQDGIEVIGIWHSHPETPARMSAEDLRLAYAPGVAYVILSLSEPEDRALRGFHVLDGTPQEIDIKVVEDEEQ